MRTSRLPVGGVLVTVTVPAEFAGRVARVVVTEANARRSQGTSIHSPAAWAAGLVAKILGNLSPGATKPVTQELQRLDARIARFTSGIAMPTAAPDLHDLLSIMATGCGASSFRAPALDAERRDESRQALLAILDRHPGPDDDCPLCDAMDRADWNLALFLARVQEPVVVALYDSLAAAQIVLRRPRPAEDDVLDVAALAGIL